MCGIAGIVSLRGTPAAQADVARMCDAMTHRGPDDAGYLVDGPVALGVRRLSIIDVAGGHQPIFNEDESVAVFYNGEIYNFRELRGWLESCGHRFRTASDTEVIVHLWEQVGMEFPRHLNGMFAIALYDRARQEVVLARDHVGIKPLYYALDSAGLVFGSEVKVLLASGRVARRLDVDGLAQFLSWEYVPGAGTLLQDIRRLEAGRMLVVELASASSRIEKYWDLLDETSAAPARSDAEWESDVAAAIERAVGRQLVSDVPLGAFLSGGVDSSLVVAAMGQAQTFSIGFEDPSYDETRWSRRVAAHLGVSHEVEIIRPQALELFERLMHFMDDPIGDFSIFPTYLVSRLAARRVKVVLSGDGGDELFGGYESFRAEEHYRAWLRLPAWLRHGLIEPVINALPPTSAKKGPVNKARRFIEGARLEPDWGHARWRVFCDEALRKRLFTEEARRALVTPVGAHVLALRKRAQDRDRRDQALYVDFSSYLVDNCLAKVDRMSMVCSIEARVPLLDRELVELAFRVPPDLKYDRRQSKILLKRIAARRLPRDCVYRPKQGFSIPIKNWLREEFRGLVEHHLDSARLRAQGLFEPAVVERLWREHLANRANHSHILWSLLVFQQWRERWNVAA
ncbi:MAG: asparagine synthase (glutamine-hydrolyzing) [Steroidobacteraceae bacterium]